MVFSLLIFHLFTRRFFGFLFLPQQKGVIKEALVTLLDGQIWLSVVSLNAQLCPLSHDVARVDR
jgi:hypothetical protein